MDFDLDPLNDILSEPATCTARAGAKFRPKSKPHSRKEEHAGTLANPTNAAKNIPVTLIKASQDSLHTFSQPLMPNLKSCTTTVADPFPALPQSQEMGNNTEVSHSGDGKYSARVEIFSQHFIDKEHVDSRDALHSNLTISNTHGDLQTGFARLGGEATDICCSLDDIFHEFTPTNAVSKVRKFQPRVKLIAQAEDELTISHAVATAGESSISHDKAPMFHTNEVDEKGGPGQSSLLSDASLRPLRFGSTDSSPEFVPLEAVNNRESGAFDYEELLINAEGLGREEHTFLESVASAGEYIDDDLHLASRYHGFVDLSNGNDPLPAMTDHSPEFLLNENLIHHANAVSQNEFIPQVVDLQINSSKECSKSWKRAMRKHSSNVEDVSQESLCERPVVADERTESGKLSRRLRRKSSARGDTISGGTEEHMDPLAEPSKYSLVDEDVHSDDGIEYRQDASCPKNSGNAKSANKKAGRRRMDSSEGPDSSSNRTAKKKFSHSTRRNRRKLDKTLLENPEEEIDTQKLPIKDLILLWGVWEKRRKKDAATSKNSLPSQSGNNAFSEDASTCGQGPNPGNNEAAPRKLNYHSHMKKGPKKIWSKQDTDLFYESIKQFGTDFTMIGQLFPDLDSDPVRRRHLVKLKYKNEERRHPKQLNDALANRSNDNSYLELVLEKLRQAEQDFDGGVESVGISGEEEDNYSEINEVMEPEPIEVPNGMETAGDPDMPSPVKSVQVTEEDACKWSAGESDFDDYVAF